MTIKELKEIIKELPDEMNVVIYFDSGCCFFDGKYIKHEVDGNDFCIGELCKEYDFTKPWGINNDN